MELTYNNQKVLKLFSDINPKITNLSLVVCLPLLVTFMTELIQRVTIIKTLDWIFNHKLAFSIEYTMVFLIFIMFSLLINRFNISFLLTSLLFILLAIINFYKLNIREESLYPWDFISHGEFFNIAGTIDIHFEIRIVSIFLLLILVCPIFKTNKKILRNITKRSILFLCALGVFTISLNYVCFNNTNLSKLNIPITRYDQKNNYKNNGFILAFTNNLENLFVKKPNGYGEESVRKVFNNLKLAKSEDVKSSIKPNIIMIMNEAFWDPTLLPGVTFSEDPITTVHELEKKGNVGWLVSPQFGGGTANVEFEALTGYTMDFLPSDAFAYEQYIRGNFESIVSVLNSQGYNSIALHPYDRTFYNRNNVYDYLGFKNFITQEAFEKEDYKGVYISDNSTAKKIINIFEQNQNKEKPLFNFTITMQNHYAYDKDKYGSNDKDSITVNSQNLSKEEKEIVQSYATGAKDADQMLKTLIDYFGEINDPTVIVFFGDHLPSLDGYGVYQNTGFVTENTFEEYANKLHKTPLIIWNNFNKNIKNPGDINANYLSPYLLSEIGLNVPYFFDFVNSLRTTIPAYKNGIFTSHKNVNSSLSSLQQNMWNDYELLQYDYMFGKRYGEKYMYNMEGRN